MLALAYEVETGFVKIHKLNSMTEWESYKPELVSKALRAAAQSSVGFDPSNHHNALKCPYCNPQSGAALLSPLPGTREEVARIIGGDIFGSPDNQVGPATKAARQEALRKADAILALPPAPMPEREGMRETVYANARTTLIGFENELTERDIKFICDQISRKVALACYPAVLKPEGE